MMLGCFEAMVKIPFSSSDCKVTVYLVALQCLIIGAGPCGLRTAIDLSFLGAKVVVIEKRDAFSRNNVLHLWPFTIHDLRGLGAKKFYGKFCAGSIDHISKYSCCWVWQHIFTGERWLRAGGNPLKCILHLPLLSHLYGVTQHYLCVAQLELDPYAKEIDRAMESSNIQHVSGIFYNY